MQKIGIIGPGNNLCSKELYEFGVSLGQQLTTSDRVIVCGGKGGFMEAVCKGTKLSPGAFNGQTIGILPEDTETEANPFVDVVIPTGMGIARNIINRVGRGITPPPSHTTKHALALGGFS